MGFGVGIAQAQVDFTFVEVGGLRGIGPYQMAEGMGGGIAAADFDNDGDIDVFVPNGEGVPDQLYRNLGNGQFEEIAAAAGVASTEKNRCALWLDYDGDQDLDLLVANDIAGHPTAYRLYRQYADGLFEDVTVEAGLFVPMGPKGPLFSIQSGGGICAGDLNNDGYLDVFAPMWNAQSHLFMNNGDATFTDATASSGIGTEPRHGHQSMMFDFNTDGWLDIYQNIDADPNLLWINQQDGTFVEMASAAGMASNFNDMGMSLGDYDNDGDFDVYITNVFWDNVEPKLVGHNVLLLNASTDGTLRFADVSEALGVNQGGWGWGTTFIDGNVDGWLDIAATNGWVGGGFGVDPSKFFLNLGGDPVSFVDQSVAVNFADTYWGSSLIAFDYDRDGDLDLMQACNRDGPLRLLENQPVGGPGPGKNYLVVKPRMEGPNHRAIGAVVRLQVGNQQLMRLITAGTSYLGQEPAEAFFGVGGATTITSVTVEWPDGVTTVRYGVSSNQVLTIDPTGPRCGDDDCMDGEDPCNCPEDCGPPPPSEVPESTCQDGLDNDCDGFTDCDDRDCCDDADICTYDHCIDNACLHVPNVYGDVDHDGTVDIFDLFCILNGFAGDFGQCQFEDIDIEPCEGNGVVDVFDLFAVLNAFAGNDPCCGGLP